jgi:Tol biopolymer transport system component
MLSRLMMPLSNVSKHSQIFRLLALLAIVLTIVAFGLSRCGNFETEDPDRFIVSEYGKRLLVVDYSGNVKQTFDFDVRDTSWSPDGNQIAFADRQNNLGILEIESGKVTHLEVGTVTSFTQYLRWSPDGRQLAFISEPEQERWSVGLIQLTKPLGVTLSKSCDYECRDPNWLPDGSGLIYTEDLGVQSDDLVTRVRKLNIKTGAVNTLFSTNHGMTVMRLSPDGTQLAMVAHGEGGRYYLSDLNGQVQPLPLSAADFVCWVKDGGNLAFTGWVGGTTATFIYNLEHQTTRRLYPQSTLLSMFENPKPDALMLDCR